MADGVKSTPSRLEAWSEQRFPPYRFGTVLLLLVVMFVFMASGVNGVWAQVVSVVLQCLTLLAALLAARTGHHLLRAATVVCAFAILSAAVAAFVSSSDALVGAFFALNVLLVGAAPVAIARSLWLRQIVDVNTVLGAICIYVLIGMMFSFLYTTIGLAGDEPFFSQTSHATLADYLYFSFITLCTVGYGDFTPAQGIGRALASFEALLGQLYLVTIVAVIVSRITPRRGAEPAAADDAPADDAPADDAPRAA